MTESEARKATKYFAEGVSAGIWCYSGKGNWEVRISRGNTISFLSLDPLKRRIYWLRESISRGDKSLSLTAERAEYPEDEIDFPSPDDAWLCIEAIGAAVRHIQAQRSVDPAWMELPSDLFSRPIVNADAEIC